jgi:hypothetical protein
LAPLGSIVRIADIAGDGIDDGLRGNGRCIDLADLIVGDDPVTAQIDIPLL